MYVCTCVHIYIYIYIAPARPHMPPFLTSPALQANVPAPTTMHECLNFKGKAPTHTHQPHAETHSPFEHVVPTYPNDRGAILHDSQIKVLASVCRFVQHAKQRRCVLPGRLLSRKCV